MPPPLKRLGRVISLSYDMGITTPAVLWEAISTAIPAFPPPNKLLKRMPHVFDRVLELPVPSHFPVEIREARDRFLFVAELDGGQAVADGFAVEVVEIVPGATKVSVRQRRRRRRRRRNQEEEEDGEEEGILEELVLEEEEEECNKWRYRLPACTHPGASTAVFRDGILTVTVPKDVSSSMLEDALDRAEEKWYFGGHERKVAVPEVLTFPGRDGRRNGRFVDLVDLPENIGYLPMEEADDDDEKPLESESESESEPEPDMEDALDRAEQTWYFGGCKEEEDPEVLALPERDGRNGQPKDLPESISHPTAPMEVAGDNNYEKPLEPEPKMDLAAPPPRTACNLQKFELDTPSESLDRLLVVV